MVTNNSVPTLRKIRACLDEIDSSLANGNKGLSHRESKEVQDIAIRMIFRLTSEVLTKDEKQRAAHESLFQAVRAMRAMKTRTQQDVIFNEMVLPAWEEIRDLIPAPQDGKPNYDAQRKYLNSIVNTAWDERRVAWLESIRKECLALGLEKTHPKLAKFLSEVEFCTPAPQKEEKS